MSAPVSRRLAAIVIADVVGYTRLMERDDSGTYARVRLIRDEVVDPAILSHGGRIVKTAGDGLVAEFTNALAALRASIQIQRQMAARNTTATAEERIDYRIGVNLGDIMVQGSEIAGDGVNVASRLESLVRLLQHLWHQHLQDLWHLPERRPPPACRRAVRDRPDGGACRRPSTR